MGLPGSASNRKKGHRAWPTSARGQLRLAPLSVRAQWGLTTALQFDREGNLWFGMIAGKANGQMTAIVRRAPNGTVSEFELDGEEAVTSLMVGAAGEIWFTRAAYKGGAKVGWITPAGAVTEIPLAAESVPKSITEGPDGAIWFTEAGAGQIGRVTTSGEVQLFPLGPMIEPREIVAGPDGALWFSENGKPGPHGTARNRIGRITASGEVTQLPIRFGRGTGALAVDPRGFIWFTTDEGEISSISPVGTVGGRGCAGYCGTTIEGIALTRGGALWFAAGSRSCGGCGGGAALMTQIAGTEVGKVPAGALKPPKAAVSARAQLRPLHSSWNLGPWRARVLKVWSSP